MHELFANCEIIPEFIAAAFEGKRGGNIEYVTKAFQLEVGAVFGRETCNDHFADLSGGCISKHIALLKHPEKGAQHIAGGGNGQFWLLMLTYLTVNFSQRQPFSKAF